jgi:hypothetical protein
MRYIVAYTLKHNHDLYPFEDKYLVFELLSVAESYYELILSEKSIDKDWHVWTASLCNVLKTTY